MKTTQTIKDLRQICQSSRKPTDTWHGKNIARPISIYITVIFLKLGISANIATAIFVFTGILASISLTFGGDTRFLISALLMQLWYILDHVDGEVARYRKQTSLTGVYFDHVAHYIVHPLFFFCLGFGLYLKNHSLFLLTAGFLGALSTMLISIITDIFALLSKNKSTPVENMAGNVPKTSLTKKTFSFLYSLCTFPVIIDIFLIVCIIDLTLPRGLLNLFLVSYSILLTLIWVNRLFFTILTKKIDRIN